MARFFIGSATHKLDGKGRVSLPSDFRDVLKEQAGASGGAEEFVLVPAQGDQAFHTGLSRSGHEALVRRISGARYPNAAVKRAVRQRFIAAAKPISVEEGGRFVLPRELREVLGLTNAVQFVGDGETFQIWQPERYAELAVEVPEAELDAVDLDFAGLVE
ncbi:MAG: division/cell wall cluster transcriptional repressor MraZ [Pikeienuella sp.]